MCTNSPQSAIYRSFFIISVRHFIKYNIKIYDVYHKISEILNKLGCLSLVRNVPNYDGLYFLYHKHRCKFNFDDLSIL